MKRCSRLEYDCWLFLHIFLFVCSIKCTAGGAAARRRCILFCGRMEKVCRRVNKHIIIGFIVKIATLGLKGLNQSSPSTQCPSLSFVSRIENEQRDLRTIVIKKFWTRKIRGFLGSLRFWLDLINIIMLKIYMIRLMCSHCWSNIKLRNLTLMP